MAGPAVAILRRALRETENPPGGPSDRVFALFEAFRAEGAEATPVTFGEGRLGEVRGELLKFDVVLVFIDPINPPDSLDRSRVDPLLRDVASRGVVVSTHPDVIMKMGTKEVLYTTRHLAWGTDTHLYRSPQEFAAEFPLRLAMSGPRVLKQHRGNGGDGVWKVELTEESRRIDRSPDHAAVVRVLHAQRGSTEEELPLGEFLTRCAHYFEGPGCLIDQPFQARLGDGQIRVYVVGKEVAGFGLQRVKALMPAPPGTSVSDLEPEPRRYYDAELPETQSLRRLMEDHWIEAMQDALDIPDDQLPLLWDCDFLLGPQDAAGNDTYVLCEINVSSVIPFPPSAAVPLARATVARVRSG